MLSCFRGKGRVEEIPKDTGIPHAIIRPALLFGEGDLLRLLARVMGSGVRLVHTRHAHRLNQA